MLSLYSLISKNAPFSGFMGSLAAIRLQINYAHGEHGREGRAKLRCWKGARPIEDLWDSLGWEI